MFPRDAMQAEQLTRDNVGHLAVQFAAKMGCHVTVLSSSEAKRDEATKLGASEYVITKGVKELKVSRPLDRLIVTTSAQPDWEQLIPILANNATIHPVSVADGNFSIPYSKCRDVCCQFKKFS